MKAHEEIKEIPKRQRYASRPLLSEILKSEKLLDKEIKEAVIEHGYTQKEVADFLGVHYSTVSRKVKEREYARNKT